MPTDDPTNEAPLGREIGIFVRCGKRLVKPFWISLQRDGSVSVGCTDERYQVARRGMPDGRVVADEIVRNPHVTFHPPTRRLHLIGNRGGHLGEAITWGSEIPAGEPPHLWIECVTSPIAALRARKFGAQHGRQQVERWPVETRDDTKSPFLAVDFATPFHAALGSGDKTAKFLAWGQAVFRFRLGLIDPQPPQMRWYTWG